jgi:phage-related protein
MKKNFEVYLSEEAKRFIKTLDIKVQRKVVYNIQKSREANDPRLLKKLSDEIWEFRTRYDKLQIRLLAFWDPNINSLIIYSHGFIKKSHGIPETEMSRAIEFRKQYLKRKK